MITQCNLYAIILLLEKEAEPTGMNCQPVESVMQRNYLYIRT
ncbi:hypothetical protein HMPREF9086_3885 [Enterobacter hormaechei ATCC 49162]|nr:hypothetical protein HMPREF9086_3885 [Enterobacter hormaechei ATCC 49162]